MTLREFLRRFGWAGDATRARVSEEMRAASDAEREIAQPLAPNPVIHAWRNETLEVRIDAEHFVRMMCAVAGVPEVRDTTIRLSQDSGFMCAHLHLGHASEPLTLRIESVTKVSPRDLVTKVDA